MVDSNIAPQREKTPASLFQPALLFVLAACVLMLMSAWEPRLALPLVAFFAMSVATRLLGQRLYRDATGAAGQTD